MEYWIIISLAFLGMALIVVGTRAAYFNGVNDGYGAGRERSNPGYRKARTWLEDHRSYHWPELNSKAVYEADFEDDQ